MFPHLVTATNVPRLTKVGDVDWGSIDAAFCCLPHATTQEILNSLPKHIKVVDLSADFRLKDTKLYAEWYALNMHSWRAPHTLLQLLRHLSPLAHDMPGPYLHGSSHHRGG